MLTLRAVADICEDAGRLSVQGFRTAPPFTVVSLKRPAEYMTWVKKKATTSAAFAGMFERLFEAGRTHVTTGDMGDAQGHPIVDYVATIAFTAYRILRLAPAAALPLEERPSPGGQYKRQFGRVGSGGWLGYDAEDWFRALVLFLNYREARRRRRMIMTGRAISEKEAIGVHYWSPAMDSEGRAEAAAAADKQVAKAGLSMRLVETLEAMRKAMREAGGPAGARGGRHDPMDIEESRRRLVAMLNWTAAVARMSRSEAAAADGSLGFPPSPMANIRRVVDLVASRMDVHMAMADAGLSERLIGADVVEKFVEQEAALVEDVLFADPSATDAEQQEKVRRAVRERLGRAYATDTLVGISSDCEDEVGPACRWAGLSAGDLRPDPEHSPDFQLRIH